MVTDIIIIILLFLIATSLYIIIYSIYYKKESKDIDSSILQTRVNIILSQEDIVTKVDNILESLIKHAVETYMVMKAPVKDNNLFIDNQTAEELSKYTIETVKKNMTPEVLSTIRLIENINSKEEVEDYIALKVKIFVIAFILDANGPIV